MSKSVRISRIMIPWYLKIIVKIALSRLPLSYHFWSGKGLFKHGQMGEYEYPRKIFFLHYNEVFSGGCLPNEATFLELGPGDSVASALCAAAMGVRKIYLVDVGCFATRDMGFYARFAESLGELGFSPPKISATTSFSEMLELCGATYLTEGVFSLRNIPSNSIHYIWSHSTLEHIRKSEFYELSKELYRIVQPKGAMSHSIDLQDHLDGRLNNLRFSERIWESEWMARSGFYTNRLRASSIINFFRNAGFVIENERRGQWKNIPIQRKKLDASFQNEPEEELITRTLALILRKP